MKIKTGYMLREVAGNYIVVAVGQALNDFNGMISLNETGAFLWKQLEQGVTKEQLIEKMTAEYEIDQASAERDAGAFIEKLTASNLLDE